MTYERDFRVLVFQVAEKLTLSDRDSLRYIYGLPGEERESGLEILRVLNQKGIYSNARQLSDVLRTVHREDLAKIADSFGTRPAAIAHHTPAQLRGKCDADIAQAKSVASELQKIRGFITNNGLSEEALGRIYHELGEMEREFQVLLLRCEIMHRCCTLATTDERKLDDETLVRDGTSRLGHPLCGAAINKKVSVAIPLVISRSHSAESCVSYSAPTQSHMGRLAYNLCHTKSAENILHCRDHTEPRNCLRGAYTIHNLY